MSGNIVFKKRYNKLWSFWYVDSIPFSFKPIPLLLRLTAQLHVCCVVFLLKKSAYELLELRYVGKHLVKG